MEEKEVVSAEQTQSENANMEAVVEENAVKAEKEVRKFVRKPAKRKVCVFCVEGAKEIDYKDVAKLRKFITEKGKILPSRQTNLCARHQRQVSQAIKRARYMALLPYRAD